MSRFAILRERVAACTLIFLISVSSPVICTGQDNESDSRDNQNDRRERRDESEQDLENSDLVGTTIQLPTLGVSIDAQGLLKASGFTDPGGQLIRQRMMAARNKLKGNLKDRVPFRKISLRRLDEEIKKRNLQGKPLSDEMLRLAGLTRAEFVFVYPDQRDIVIAGPAEPWVKNQSGRVVGMFSGKPTLLLEDLAAALRTYTPDRGLNSWVACSIDPTSKGIERLKEFQKTIPNNIPPYARAQAADQLATGLQQSLGDAEIKVYGVSRKTHLAQVMVEADYRMKLMAVGLERPPIKMVTFIGSLKSAPRNMQRWWFMPNYKCLREAPDRNSLQLIGDGVILSTQNIDFDKRARIVATGIKPSSSAKRYATSFTKNYRKISRVRPVYAQLRNIIDWLVLSAWLKKNDALNRIDWTPQTILDENQLSIENAPNPKRCPCVANAVWKRHVLILPAGGGVSILASNALTDKNIVVDDAGRINKVRATVKHAQPQQKWWWD